MLGMTHTRLTDTQAIQVIIEKTAEAAADSIVRKMTEKGHVVCFHAEDWGVMKTDMAAMKKEIMGGDGIPSLRVEMAGIRTERKIAGYLINIAVGLLSAAFGAKFGR